MFDVNGKELSTIYDINGNSITTAYDIHGNSIKKDYDLIAITYNVQKQGQLNTPTIQREIIDKYSPDIIGMQEYRVSYEEQGVYREYPYTANSSAVLQNYGGLLSKYQLSNVGCSLFEVRYADPSGYVYGTFNYNGKEIYWLNVHTSPYGADYTVYREPEIQEILELIKDKEYYIITGDFNSNMVQNEQSPEYIALYKPFADMGCHFANCCEEFGFNDTFSSSNVLEGAVWKKLDTIITSPNIDIVNAVVDETKLNYTNGSWEIDHLPVVAYLKLI